MSSIGLNVALDGSHDPALIRSLGARWIRIVATPDHDLTDYFQRCRAAGLKTLLILARESGGDYAEYRDRYAELVSALQVGNEMDHESPSSWTMTPAEFTSLGRATRAIFPRPFPLVAGGLVSGQPSWLDGVDLSWADRIAVHPYGKSPSETWPHPGWGTGYMGDLLDAYRPYALGKPLIVSELGLPSTEVPEEFQAEYVGRCADFLNRREDIDVWFWFCISDSMVPGFGLLGPRGREKPAARTFRVQAALAAQSDWPNETGVPMPPPTTLPRGLDVASYQGDPDWAAVSRDGYQFAITKLTEGTNYVNPTFARNWQEIKRAGMIRGAYHFARPSANTPDAEAEFFLGNLAHHGGPVQPGDILALDIEDERAVNGGAYGTVAGWSLGFVQYIEAAVGFKPLIYTGAWYTGPHGFAQVPELAEYGLWLAAYQAAMPAPPAPWGSVAVWQFTSSGRVAGIAGDVDVNVFNGPIDRLALYGKPGGIVDPTPPPPDEYEVGAGIRERMVALGDRPASNEHYITTDWSEAVGTSGRVYRYVVPLGRVYVYDPAA